MNHISYIVRKTQVDWTDTTKPGDGVPGGGVATKTWNVKQAVPGIQITDNFESDRPIVILDPLAFSNNVDLHLPTIRDSKAFKKVLWIEEQTLLRWPGAFITQTMATHSISSAYQTNILNSSSSLSCRTVKSVSSTHRYQYR